MFVRHQPKPSLSHPSNTLHWDRETNAWMEFNWCCGKTIGKESCRACMDSVPDGVYPFCMAKHFIKKECA